MSDSDSGSAAEEILRMKRELGVELDRDLASNLGLDPTAISAWRRRGKVPAKYLLRYRRRIDEACSVSGVDHIGSVPQPTELRSAYIYSLVAQVARLLPNQLGFGDEHYVDVWIGFRIGRLHRYLMASFRHHEDKDDLRAEFERLRSIIDSADLPLWIETLP